MEQQVTDSNPVSENQTSPQPVTDQPQESPTVPKKKSLLLPIMLAALLLLAVGGYFIVSAIKNEAHNKALIVETASSPESIQEERYDENLSEYYSPKWGISFKYPSNKSLTVTEIENKIIIHNIDKKVNINTVPGDEFETEGIEVVGIIEVFKKDPSKTVEVDIADRFLKNAPKNCAVEQVGSGADFNEYQIITDRGIDTSTMYMEEKGSLGGGCESRYTVSISSDASGSFRAFRQYHDQTDIYLGWIDIGFDARFSQIGLKNKYDSIYWFDSIKVK